MAALRIGHGFDVHAFGPGDHFMLGGVRINHSQGVQAHSDGDVLLHALCDALLGAAALGDIGLHFPDTDPAYSNIDSRILLRRVYSLILERGWQAGNVDTTIIVQSPKLAPYLPAMAQNIAQDLKLAATAVGIKATSTEHLGYLGRGEGIAAQAVVLLERSQVA